MESARPAPPLTPKPIMELAMAFQRSRPLLTAFELGLFTALHEETRTSEATAAVLDTEPRATDRLMNALVALGLLEKREGRFGNTPLAEEYLVKGRPDYMAGLGHTNHLWDTWSRMTEVVRTGHPAGLAETNDRGDDWLRPFIAAMHFRARQNAGEVVGMLDLEGVARVLDVGGGSGAYAMSFVRARRGIAAVVFDLPNVLPLARMYIAQEGLAAEVATVSGDYLTTSLGAGYDLVFMSAVIHSNAADDNRLLFRKAAAALNPGGQLVVQDFLMNEERDGPVTAALFALNMLVGTPEGDTYTESEVRSWMTEAGFRSITRTDTTFGTNLVVGRIQYGHRLLAMGAITDTTIVWKNLADVFRGMAMAGYRRQLRSEAVELQDLFLLMWFMDLWGLPNPAALYLADVHPYLVEEFHLWHRRMGMDRSPLATFSCC